MLILGEMEAVGKKDAITLVVHIEPKLSFSKIHSLVFLFYQFSCSRQFYGINCLPKDKVLY